MSSSTLRVLGLVPACLLLLAAASDIQLTQVLPPSDLETTERSAFTSDGRYWIIGTRAQGRDDAGSWIVEVTRSSGDSYVATNYVAGTLEGTSDGRTHGTPVGEPCLFAGMTVFETRLYASCVNADLTRASLFEIDAATGSVRTEYFTTCNAEPSVKPCSYVMFYPNGMATDSTGRIYLSNTAAHLNLEGPSPAITVEGSRSLTQVVVNGAADSPQRLSFTHRDWFSTDILRDGLVPNGIQIEGNVLYYAAGANINRIDLREDGRAGAASVHYAGPALSVIDDFAVRDGRMLIARALSPALVLVDRAPVFGTARELGTRDMPLDAIPSSLAYQADVPAGNPLFPAGSMLVTSFFGGGLYLLTGLDE